MKHLFEYVNFERQLKPYKRETKKSQKTYYKKKINTTKMDLEGICDLLKLPFDDLQYLGSGSFGDAYRVGDKVIKLTTDLFEAKSVYNLIQNKRFINSIVKYYSVNMWKKNRYDYCYVILMDYVENFYKYCQKISNQNLFWNVIYSTIDVVYYNWKKIKNLRDFIEKIEKEVDYINNYDNKTEEIKPFKIKSKLYISIVDKFWDLYLDLEYLKKSPDLHIDNLGIKDDRLVLFDFREFEIVFNKFNLPSILK